MNVKITSTKNRFFRPYAQATDIQLLFDKGINPVSGLLSCLMQAERIELKSPGNYRVKNEFLPVGSGEYTFKSSKERNDVPMEVLLECPALVDAVDRDQVAEYLSPFADFGSMFEEGTIEETSILDSLGDDV